MRFDYDPKTDSLYIKFIDRPSVESEEVSPGIVHDYDEGGALVGIDIEHASKIIAFSRVIGESALRAPVFA